MASGQQHQGAGRRALAPPSPRPARRARPGRAPGLRRRIRLPISAILVGGFGLLMLVAVAGVLALGLVSAGRNTYSLLGDKADLALDNVASRLREQLDPVFEQANEVGALIADGTIDRGDPRGMAAAFVLAMTATPQVTGFSFTDPALDAVRVGRFGNELRTFIGSLAARQDIRLAMAEGEVRPSTHWADPVWDPQLGATLVTVRRPIRRDGAYLGLLMIGVSLADLSQFLSDLYIDTGMAAFILYDEEHVIAHPSLTRRDFEFAADDRVPLPRRAELGDEVLAGPWDLDAADELPGMGEFQLAAFEDAAGEDWVILTRPSISYGSRPWTLGIVFPASEVSDEIERFAMALAAGLVILVVSLLAAFLIGRSLSGKIRRLADAASSLSALDLADAPSLPDSRIRELASAAAAFNTMVSGLRWFETYVPRSLVLRLIRTGAGTSFASEERQVTVMFTDIEGFSEVSRRLPAAATADLLNRHFSLLARAIEEEGGTVDKFIGDAVMAFWGAPEDQSDHAARALRAAAAIGRAIRLENLRAAVTGGRPLRLRVGLHSGPVVVGNIGSESRINFTIVGETVNVAARLEELGKQLDDGRDAIILASGETARIARYAVPMTPLGPHHLRGQPDPVEVFRVDWAG